MIPPASLLLELASKGLFWRFCYLWDSTSLRVGPLTGKTHSKKLAVDQCILVPTRLSSFLTSHTSASTSCSLCFFDSSTHSNQGHVRVCIRWLRSQIFPQLDSFKEESLSLGFRKLKMQLFRVSELMEAVRCAFAGVWLGCSQRPRYQCDVRCPQLSRRLYSSGISRPDCILAESWLS